MNSSAKKSQNNDIINVMDLLAYTSDSMSDSKEEINKKHMRKSLQSASLKKILQDISNPGSTKNKNHPTVQTLNSNRGLVEVDEDLVEVDQDSVDSPKKMEYSVFDYELLLKEQAKRYAPNRYSVGEFQKHNKPIDL